MLIEIRMLDWGGVGRGGRVGKDWLQGAQGTS